MLPRPDLRRLGITHRRIPVNAIGRDVYLDGRPFLAALQRLAPTPLRASPADAAYDALGYRSFAALLPLVPAALLGPDAIADRAQTLPIFARKDYPELRPSAKAELRELMHGLERDVLGKGHGQAPAAGPWIGGHADPGIADVHASWMIKWALETLEVGKEPGFGRDAWPRVWAW